jgi:hypothetical protein
MPKANDEFKDRTKIRFPTSTTSSSAPEARVRGKGKEGRDRVENVHIVMFAQIT